MKYLKLYENFENDMIDILKEVDDLEGQLNIKKSKLDEMREKNWELLNKLFDMLANTDPTTGDKVLNLNNFEFTDISGHKYTYTKLKSGGEKNDLLYIELSDGVSLRLLRKYITTTHILDAIEHNYPEYFEGETIESYFERLHKYLDKKRKT